MSDKKVDLKKAALWYASHGLPVFPLKPRSKEPLTPHGFQDASTDPEQIESWWKKWPDANIGLPTGAVSGRLALDVDPRNGGAESLDRLILEHGRFPDTAEQQTGGGGRHIVFRHPGGPVPKTLAAGIDLKGDGGYIVVAPSVHPSGNPYQWDGLTGAKGLLNLADVRLGSCIASQGRVTVRVRNRGRPTARSGERARGTTASHLLRAR